MPRQIITIDGPAGVGKSTIAALLADRLGLPFLDTGAMFRFMALTLGEEGMSMSEAELEDRGFSFSLRGSGRDTVLYANGKPLGDEIRTEEIGLLASKLAARPQIRSLLLNAQRSLGERQSLVAEGRDMGSVVFQNASHKFFLDAEPGARALRRWKEFKEKGGNITLKELEERIRQRDQQDRERTVAPLKPAPDAQIVDTSNMDIAQVLQTLEKAISGSGKS